MCAVVSGNIRRAMVLPHANNPAGKGIVTYRKNLYNSDISKIMRLNACIEIIQERKE